MIVPLLVAIAGLMLGGAALYFSLGGAGKADDAQGELEAITAKAEALETRLRDLEEKYNAMDSDIKSAQGSLNRMARDINTEFKEAGGEINRNRDMIEAASDRLTELINTLNRQGRPSGSGAPSNEPSAPPAPSTATSTTESPAERLPVASNAASDPTEGPVVIGSPTRSHTIRPGDTFTQLSEQYRVSVSSILAANPDVDPRRLAVGQKIKIPAK